MKDATVSARVEFDVKNEAEDILQKLGIPVFMVPGTRLGRLWKFKISEVDAWM